ncbi:CD209 antigen-like protein E [Archocentrus centrarchus]|uniref:CD209 antigen-like protein E n=1 Tax=Archocentrus centrarchus TaxID=63155 RepID=UPI0011E9CCA8|nr:CD209 antigen-like protein E [Archocentrus centrarchus]
MTTSEKQAMEEIYVNAEYDKSANPIPSTINPKGPRSSKRSFYSGVIVSLGLLSVFLMVGLITLGVYLNDSAASVSAVSRKLSSMIEDRDVLHVHLTEKIKELGRLQNLSKQRKTCPAGWRMFSCSCYRLSESSGSWDQSRKDCRDNGADLVVIESPEEQTFVSTITSEPTWIGLNDKEQEGAWKWVDGTRLTWSNWAQGEPNNAGEEDCGHLESKEKRPWNDFRCTASMKWICEKIPQHNE